MKKYETKVIAIWVLTLIAIGLGVAVYFKYNPIQKTQPKVAQNTSSKKMSTEEKKTAVLQAPNQNSTEIEQSKHFQLADSISVESNQIIITNCKPDPLVTRVELGSQLTVKNEGPDSIDFGFGKVQTIKPGTSATFTANFDKGIGLYGYDCKGPLPSQPIGFIIAIPTEAR